MSFVLVSVFLIKPELNCGDFSKIYLETEKLTERIGLGGIDL